MTVASGPAPRCVGRDRGLLNRPTRHSAWQPMPMPMWPVPAVAPPCVRAPRTNSTPTRSACVDEQREGRPTFSVEWAWMPGLVRGYPSLNNFFFLIHTRGAARGSGCDAAGAGLWCVGPPKGMPLEGGWDRGGREFVRGGRIHAGKQGEWGDGWVSGAIAAAQVGPEGATPQRCVSINDMHRREDVGWSAHG